MPSLRELQIHVMDALLTVSPDGAAPWVLPTGGTARSRLRLYQGTIRSNFAEALRSTYPVIWRLVGEDYFRQAAWTFQLRHPSESGDLNHAGGAFPDYLRALHPDDDFRYLADLARLEWLIQESLLAQDHGRLDLHSLARVDTAAYEVLCFNLHPTLRLFESDFPALRIWEANAGDAEPPMMDLGSGGERLAVMRHEGRLRFHRLTRGEYDFLRSLADGWCLATAVAGATANDPAFDATLALQRFVAANAVVNFAIPDTRL